jgi:glutamate dehydrogenase/leucine dehydrogenase
MGWNAETMFQVVETKISANTRIMLERARNNDTRAAALEIAKERVREAMEYRGWIRK